MYIFKQKTNEKKYNEDKLIFYKQVQYKMSNNYNINLETVSEIAPIKIYPAKALAHIYSFLGKNERLGLTGRPVTDIGYLATSKLYTMRGQILAFTPSVNIKLCYEN